VIDRPPHLFRGLLAGLVVSLCWSAWADYEVYRKKGFEKVEVILEKTQNPDGTLTIKAKSTKDSSEILFLDKVVKIVEVQAKKPLEMKVRPPDPTPTVFVPPVPQAQGQTASSNPSFYDRSRPWLPDFLFFGSFTSMAIGIVIGVFFILFLIFRPSHQ
jgi:hypothetical protein